MNALRHAVFLAVRHLRHHRGRSLLIGLALFLVAFLPIAVDGLVDAGERSLRSRGDSTPMVAGAPGAPIDLVLAALYFRTPPEDRMRMGDLEALTQGDLATVLPLVLGDRVKSAPLVGVGTVLLVAVVIALSIRIRATEIETMHLVGCGRGRVPLILGTEVAVLVGLAIGAAVIAGRLVAIAMPAVERLLLG